MPKKIKNWTAAGNGGDARRRKCDGWGRLTNDDGRLIMFGTEIAIRGSIYNACPVTTPCIIDLTNIAHGTVHDTKETTIRCFIAATDLIHCQLKAYKAAYVHCDHGNSRTAFVLIAYLIRHEGFSWDDASELVTAGQEERVDINFKLRTQGTQGNYAEWLESKSAAISLNDIALSDYSPTHANVSATSHDHKAVYEVCTNRERIRKRASKRAVPSDEGSSAPANQTSQATITTSVAAPSISTPSRGGGNPTSTSTQTIGRPSKRRKTADELALEEGKAFVDRYDAYRKKFQGK